MYFSYEFNKRCNENEFNYYLESSYADFESYPGATLKDLKHKIQFPLHMNFSDIVILYCNFTCSL